MALTQGDEYYIPVIIWMGETTITPENATGVKVGIGKFEREWPDGGLTFQEESGAWLFPLTQEASLKMPEGKVDFQVKARFGTQIVHSQVTQVDVHETIFKGVW